MDVVTMIRILGSHLGELAHSQDRSDRRHHLFLAHMLLSIVVSLLLVINLPDW